MPRPDDSEIRKELELVLKNSDFERSARLSGFLKYIVDKALAGEEEKITGYSIGVDVFGKQQDFDSDNDSSVRVEAVRLRKALALYYHEEGKNDPVIIKVPRGGYKPVFLNNEQDVLNAIPVSQKKISVRKRMLGVGGLAVLLLLIYSLSTWYESKLYALPKNPVVAVGSFQFVGQSASLDKKKDMAYLLSQKLSHFNSIKNIVLNGEVVNYREYDYLLEGMVNQDETEATVEVRLMDLQQDTVVWHFVRKFDVDAAVSQEWMEDASSLIVSAVASMHGVIDTLELKKYSHDTIAHNESYKCLLEFMAYDNNKTAAKHKQARDCLEKLVGRFPDYSVAWAYLSWIYGDEARNNLNPLGDAAFAKARSLEAGMKAVEANQRDPRAHMYLGSAAFLNDNIELMKRHIQISIDLNPYDTDILASAAWKYGRIGELELNRKYSLEALALNPTPPKWYHGGAFNYYFQAGEYKTALFHALSYYQPADFFSCASLVAAYAAAGQMQDAKDLVKELKKGYPENAKKLDGFLWSWRLNLEGKSKLIHHLQEAGLEISPGQ